MASTGGFAFLALGFEGEVDHHDRVFLDDADEQDQADEGDDAEIGVAEQKRQQRADAGGGKRGENRDRVDVAFVEDAEHDVDGDEGGEDQERLVGQGGFERGGGALESGLNAGGHVQVVLGVVDGCDGVAQRGIRGEIERDGYRGELALMIDGERGRLSLEMRELRQGHHVRRWRSGRRYFARSRGLC